MVYGGEKAELHKKIKQGQVIYGDAFPYEEMHTQKRKGCNTTFATPKLRHTMLS
jgi:hypothetical protein